MSAADDSRIYGVGKYTWSGNSVFDGSRELPPAAIATRLNRLEGTLSKKEQAIAELIEAAEKYSTNGGSLMELNAALAKLNTGKGETP